MYRSLNRPSSNGFFRKTDDWYFRRLRGIREPLVDFQVADWYCAWPTVLFFEQWRGPGGQLTNALCLPHKIAWLNNACRSSSHHTRFPGVIALPDTIRQPLAEGQYGLTRFIFGPLRFLNCFSTYKLIQFCIGYIAIAFSNILVVVALLLSNTITERHGVLRD